MHLVCYFAQDDSHTAAVQERLALARPPMALVIARSALEVLSQVQTIPVRTVIADVSWPRAVWTQLTADLQRVQSGVPVLALAPTATDHDWWRQAADLLRLDTPPDLFLHQLSRAGLANHHTAPPLSEIAAPGFTTPSTHYPATTSGIHPSPSLLENTQFRQFAEIFADTDGATILETFIGWVQQACQTSRAVLLVLDTQTGEFVCRAQRGLPSALVPHCRFPQTASLSRWLAMTSRILVKDGTADPGAAEALSELELMQATVAVPILMDGRLVGILGLGPRLVGQFYSASELEALFALGGQIALAVDHRRTHQQVQSQKEMTERMLSVMPTGTVVLGADHRIAFVNAAAASILGKSRNALHGMDLRVLPSPLGDLAYEALMQHAHLPRRQVTIPTTGRPVAVTCFALDTTPTTSMLLLEDLSAAKQLEEERERRVDLEVLTNLVHYLAHELRNPLVALSTFGNLSTTSAADDPEFKTFCQSVLQPEIGRVNLILEQLLVLTNHAEFSFSVVELASVLEAVTNTEEMRASVVTSIPVSLPSLYGDAHRLETALTCILRTVTRLSSTHNPVTLRVAMDHNNNITIRCEAHVASELAPEWLLNPWQQLLDGVDDQVDLGLATAQYIIEQHSGTLHVAVPDNILTITCYLPLHPHSIVIEEETHNAQEGPRR